MKFPNNYEIFKITNSGITSYTLLYKIKITE